MRKDTDPAAYKPRQQRSRRTFARLLRATRELLDDTVFEDLTIQQIASRAGCSVGTFYERFPNKDAILPELLKNHYAEMEAEVDEAFAPEARGDADLEERVGTVVDYLVDLVRRNRGMIRTLVLRNNREPQSIPPETRRAASRILARVYDYLLDRRADIAHPQPETAVEVGLLMVVAAIRERMVFIGATQAATLSLSDTDFTGEMKRALAAYFAAGGKWGEQ